MCICFHGVSLLMESMYFLVFFVLLSIADFSCQERSMIYKGLHARISACACLAVDVLIRRVSMAFRC